MKKLRVFLVIAVIASVLSLGTPTVVHATAPDIINALTIDVVPKSDGTLDMRYAFDYCATTDFPDDAAWLDIGVANRNFSITDFGPKEWAINASPNGGGQSQVHVEFAHLPRAGECFSFFFVINQADMANLNDNTNAIFQFTPAWFDFAEIKKLTINWTVPEDTTKIHLVDPKPQSQTATVVTWEQTNLGTNQKFTVSLAISKDVYPDIPVKTNNPVQTQPDTPTSESKGISLWLILVIIVIVVLVAVVLVAGIGSSSSSYTTGRTFGGTSDDDDDDDDDDNDSPSTTCVCVASYHPPSTPSISPPSPRHGGGSDSYSGRTSSCACVSRPSCACACACAASGRAGCNEKRFGVKGFKIRRMLK